MKQFVLFQTFFPHFHMIPAEGLLPSLNQLCANIMGHLVSKGLYPVLKDLLEKGLARSKPSFSKPVLSAIFTVAWRLVFLIESLLHLRFFTMLSMENLIAFESFRTSLRQHQLYSRLLKEEQKHKTTQKPKRQFGTTDYLKILWSNLAPSVPVQALDIVKPTENTDTCYESGAQMVYIT